VGKEVEESGIYKSAILQSDLDCNKSIYDWIDIKLSQLFL